MDKVALLSPKERSELLSEAARRRTTTAAIVEKDFWVVWTLARIFDRLDLARILKFKGGTSLSKAYGLIDRFSEDIDLILDWREVVAGDPYEERSKNQQNRFNEATNEQAQQYIRQKLLPAITEAVSPICFCSISPEDAHAIIVTYPAAFSDTYLRPHILLEIGPLASWPPSAPASIESFAASEFPAVFVRPSCKVETILAERTFWEKATILHQEAHRPAGKPLPLRYARHYYDLAMMAKSSTKKRALGRIDLLGGVVAFKQRFYPSGWASYETAEVGTLKLLPPPLRTEELRRDYQAMEQMIFASRPSFDELLTILGQLEEEVNRLGAEA